MIQASEEILTKARDMFLNMGIRTVSMDDIARSLGRSKKTLYTHYPNKRNLVDQIMRQHLLKERVEIEEICDSAANAIDEWLRIFRHNCSFISAMHPSVMSDLQKYYPKAWRQFTQYKGNFIRQVVLNNMKRGVKEQLYRDDMDTDLISRIYIERLEMFADDRVFPSIKYSQESVYTAYSIYHLRGVVSQKGLEYLELKNGKF